MKVTTSWRRRRENNIARSAWHQNGQQAKWRIVAGVAKAAGAGESGISKS